MSITTGVSGSGGRGGAGADHRAHRRGAEHRRRHPDAALHQPRRREPDLGGVLARYESRDRGERRARPAGARRALSAARCRIRRFSTRRMRTRSPSSAWRCRAASAVRSSSWRVREHAEASGCRRCPASRRSISPRRNVMRCACGWTREKLAAYNLSPLDVRAAIEPREHRVAVGPHRGRGRRAAGQDVVAAQHAGRVQRTSSSSAPPTAWCASATSATWSSARRTSAAR